MGDDGDEVPVTVGSTPHGWRADEGVVRAGTQPLVLGEIAHGGRLRPRSARNLTAASWPTSSSSLATDLGRPSPVRSQKRSN